MRKELLKAKEEEEKCAQGLRKQIANAFTKAERYKTLFSKELIQDSKGKNSKLKEWATQKQTAEGEKAELKELIDVTLPYFAKFSTYLTGFHENRKNMYSKKSQHTAISSRIIDTNLPRFMRNCKQWQKIKAILAPEDLVKLNKNFAEELAELHLAEISEIFDLQNFCHYLLQNRIDSYNAILGGKFRGTEKEKIKGLNEYLNLAYQKQKDKRIRLLKLHNQILGEKNSHSFVLGAFDSERDMLKEVRKFYDGVLQQKQAKNETLLESISEFMKDFPREDLQNIYLRGELSQISQKIFDGDWAMLDRIYEDYCNQKPQKTQKPKKGSKNSENRADYYSIAELEQALLFWKKQQELTTENKAKIEKITEHCIVDYFRAFGAFDEKDFAQEIGQSYRNLRPLIKQAEDETGQCLLFADQNEGNIGKLKLFLDSVMDLLHYLKPLSLKMGKGEKWTVVYAESSGKDRENSGIIVANKEFYAIFDALYGELEPLFALYNQVRNYVTKKPYSTEKFKLNFDNATLLNGWDLNKEGNNYGMILQKEGRYYLAVLRKNDKKILKELHKAQNIQEGESCYQKMEYKLVPGPNKMLPKVFLSKKGKEKYGPDEELLSRYKQKTHLKNEPNFKLADCHRLIDYFKASIQKNEDWRVFGFQFSETSSYEDLSGFYREFEKQSYRITFVAVPERRIDEWVRAGKLFLFEIYNKDFSAKTKGKPNLHTLYWRALFDPQNLKYRDENNFVHPIFKLSGEAEIFYRRASLDKAKIEHPKGTPIYNKQHNKGEKKKFGYDISKDRRYKHDQFFFHVPLAINHAIDKKPQLNRQVHELLARDTSINIIGIDRGERNLAYYTVIDQNGRILDGGDAQGSLNEIEAFIGKTTNPVDYHELLDTAEKKRKAARENWKQIGKIKDLKDGYISQVVHKICMLMRKWNAIVVLEDLNFGFKRGRFAIEKQVYQKLERALIQKLNYLVFKDQEPFAVGSTLNGLQLCEEFQSFEKLGKQTGVLFYVPAAYTSKIDPLTGFTNLFSTANLRYSNLENAKGFFKHFDAIVYDKQQQCLRFDFCYDHDHLKKNLHVQLKNQKIWQVFAKGERLVYKPSQRKMETVLLEKRFAKLLDRVLTGFRDNENLKDAILKIEDVGFFREFLFLFKATLQIRNSCRETEQEAERDYIASPVQDEKGRFFHSDEVGRALPKELPSNADANGAYHIALKGLQYILRMREADELDKVQLAVKNTEWLEFLQKKHSKIL